MTGADGWEEGLPTPTDTTIPDTPLEDPLVGTKSTSLTGHQVALLVIHEHNNATVGQPTPVKCWVWKELARESDRSLSEGTEGTWLQLIGSCTFLLDPGVPISGSECRVSLESNGFSDVRMCVKEQVGIKWV